MVEGETMERLELRYDRGLFTEALEEGRRCQRATEANEASLAITGPAAAAIILAEAALEAFVSEISAHLERKGGAHQTTFQSIREQKRHFPGKCKDFYTALTGDDLSDETLYDEQLVPLVELRHHVLHRSAGYLESGGWPAKLAPYKWKIDHVEDDSLTWICQVLSFPTARWALRSAFEVHEKLQEPLPQDSFGDEFVRHMMRWQLEDPEADFP